MLSKIIFTFLLGLLLPMTAWADVAHRYTGDGENADFAIETSSDGVATLYLSRKPTNEPFSGVTSLALVPDDGKDEKVVFQEVAKEPGIYQAKIAGDHLPEGELVFEHGGEKNAIEVYTDGSSHGEHGHSHGDNKVTSSHSFWSYLLIAFGALLLGGMGGFMAARRLTGEVEAHIVMEKEQAQERHHKAVGLLILLGCAAASSLWEKKALAHDGHTHAEVGVADSGGSDIKVTKKSQFLIGLRTMEVETSAVRPTLQSLGHAGPKPHKDVSIKAPQAGILRGVDQISWGAPVRKGQVLGRVESIGAAQLMVPFDGTLVEVKASEGARVEAGEVLFRIVDARTLWVDAEVFQKDLPLIRKVKTARVWIQGAEEEAMDAKVVGARAIIDEQSLAAKVFLEIDNSDDKIPVGALAKVMFELPGDEKEMVVVPKKAVLSRGGEQIVFVQTGPETFAAKTVSATLGPNPGTLIILGGLDEEDRVVTEGNYQLLVGAK